MFEPGVTCQGIRSVEFLILWWLSCTLAFRAQANSMVLSIFELCGIDIGTRIPGVAASSDGAANSLAEVNKRAAEHGDAGRAYSP